MSKDAHEFLILDVFARRPFEGNQLAVFPFARELSARQMQLLARETHFSETTFIVGSTPTERGFPVRIFTPACEVPFAGHPTLGTAFVIWDRFLGRGVNEVRLDLEVGTVPVRVEEEGRRLVMSQVPPEFGASCPADLAAQALGLVPTDIDSRFPCLEVSTGLWFLIVPVRGLEAMRRIRVARGVYDSLVAKMRAKAILAFCPETEDPDCRLHVRVFCDWYDVPEDPATGSANGCLAAWLVRQRYFGETRIELTTEQGVELKRPSRIWLQAGEKDGRIGVRVGGQVVPVARGRVDVLPEDPPPPGDSTLTGPF